MEENVFTSSYFGFKVIYFIKRKVAKVNFPEDIYGRQRKSLMKLRCFRANRNGMF